MDVIFVKKNLKTTRLTMTEMIVFDLQDTGKV